MMELYHSPASPYVRKVMVTLHETGQLDRITLREVSVTPVRPDAGHAAQNPLGKIPTLTRQDGPAIYDSRVICRYLDHLAGGSLYPEGRIWEVLTLEATADGILDAAVLMVYEWRVRPEEARYAGWTDAQWQKVVRALDAIESRWLSYLQNRRIDMGHISVACALGYLDFRHADRAWRSGRPGLSAWFDKFQQRPSLQATMPST